MAGRDQSLLAAARVCRRDVLKMLFLASSLT
jgi:hypothetical protein